MTFTQALMIVRNATSGYSNDKIREAVAVVLGSLSATEEDVLDAGAAVGLLQDRARTVFYGPGARCSEIDDHAFSGAVSAGDY
jgi:hypothetical protein